MSFNRPALPQLRARIFSDLITGLKVASPVLPKAFLRVLADVIAVVIYAAYGFAAWIMDQCFPDTAEAEYLDRWAATWGVTRKDPSFATGSATFAGGNGNAIPANSVLTGPNGIEYTTNTDSVITTGAVLVAVTASASGPAGNLAAGATLSLSSPIPGVNSSAIVATGGITGGAGIEDDESLRERIAERIQMAPHGGAARDYVAWAKEVPGVTRAWVFPLQYGLGTVGVTFAVDGSGTIPSPANVEEVQNYIDSVKPITAQVTVFAPVEKVVDFTLQIWPDTLAVRESVRQELDVMIKTYGYPNNIIPLSQVIQTIAGAEGEEKVIVTVPDDDIVFAPNEIGTMGEITWL